MDTFGIIKTKLENTAVEYAKKPVFKRFIFVIKIENLKNKKMKKIY